MIVLVGDVEDSTGPDSVLWTRKATKLLIDLYEEHEEQFEDPRKKKKDVWKLITVKMTEAGYRYSQSKIENKWRSLMASHKDLRLNKRKTGQKRRGSNFPKILTSKKKRRRAENGRKTEDCGGSSHSTAVIDFPDNCLLTSLFSVGHGL